MHAPGAIMEREIHLIYLSSENTVDAGLLRGSVDVRLNLLFGMLFDLSRIHLILDR